VTNVRNAVSLKTALCNPNVCAYSSNRWTIKSTWSLHSLISLS